MRRIYLAWGIQLLYVYVTAIVGTLATTWFAFSVADGSTQWSSAMIAVLSALPATYGIFFSRRLARTAGTHSKMLDFSTALFTRGGMLVSLAVLMRAAGATATWTVICFLSLCTIYCFNSYSAITIKVSVLTALLDSDQAAKAKRMSSFELTRTLTVAVAQVSSAAILLVRGYSFAFVLAGATVLLATGFVVKSAVRLGSAPDKTSASSAPPRKHSMRSLWTGKAGALGAVMPLLATISCAMLIQAAVSLVLLRKSASGSPEFAALGIALTYSGGVVGSYLGRFDRLANLRGMLLFAMIMAGAMFVEGLFPQAPFILACQLCCGTAAGISTVVWQLTAEGSARSLGWEKSAVFSLLGSMLSAIGMVGSWLAALLIGVGVDARVVVGASALTILAGSVAVTRSTIGARLLAGERIEVVGEPVEAVTADH